MSDLFQLIKFFISSFIPIYLIFFILAIFFDEKLSLIINKIKEKKLFILLEILFYFLLVSFGAIISLYLFSNFYIDPLISPSIASISGLFANGEEIYHSSSAGKIYGLLYGPAVYIINGFIMNILGPSIFSSKLAVAIALILTFIFLYFVIGKEMLKREKFLFLGLMAGLLLLFLMSFPLEVRSDALILLFVSMALLAVIRGEGIFWPIILIGGSLGLVFNLKISAIFYFLPILFLLFKKFRAKAVVMSGFISLITAIVPFLIFKNIDFNNYLYWLSVAGKHTLVIDSFIVNILSAIFFIIPFLFFIINTDSKKNLFEISYFKFLILGMAVISLFASKTGSGASHLVPFIPLIVYGYGIFYIKNKTLFGDNDYKLSARLILIPFILIIFIFSFINISRMMRLYLIYPSAVAQDIVKILDKYSGFSIQMGYGDNVKNKNLSANLPSFRPLLVFSGNEYLLDKAALSDLKEAGMDISNNFLDNFRNCKAQIWLFTKGSEIFISTGYGKSLFSDDFRRVFYDNYQFKESTEYYDIWICKRI